MPIESENGLTEANYDSERKMSEIQQVQAQQSEFSRSEDADLFSKIKELKAVIENHR